MTEVSLNTVFKRIWDLAEALHLPELNQSTTHGTPSLKLKSAFLGRLKDADTFAIHCPLEEKPLLMESAPDIYFETDHFKGWPYILIHLDRITDAELSHRIKLAWLARAPAKLKKLIEPKA